MPEVRNNVNRRLQPSEKDDPSDQRAEGTLHLAENELPEKAKELKAKFEKMMRALFKQEGATLDISIITDEPAQDFIKTHAAVLDAGYEKTAMSDAMRERLQQSTYIFSGLKTFHELNEAFPSLLDEDGNRKTFNKFLQDVQAIDSTYNENYLRAEYNYVTASAQMAAKWEDVEAAGDRYNLQYRTAGDSRVRPEHRKLDGITLPPSHKFWDAYYPPNGWNCRCNAVSVLKDKYDVTGEDEVYERAAGALKDKEEMFRFNSGKQQKAVPDYNPYTIKKCRNCPVAQGKTKGGGDSDLCEACRLLHKGSE